MNEKVVDREAYEINANDEIFFICYVLNAT